MLADSTDALAQKAGRAYADLVAAGKDVALWPDHLLQQMVLGDEAFVLRMQALGSDRAVSDKETPKAQRASPRTVLDWLDTMPSRDEAIVAAHRHSQLNLPAISRALGLSVSRVGRIVAQQSQVSAHPAGADR